MKYTKVYFFQVIFLISLFISLQSNADSLYVFPNHWMGKWTGKLLIYNSKEIKEVYMELNIFAAEDMNHWKWTLIYGKGEFGQTRAYELILSDSAKGKYKMDEKNSIILDMAYLNNTFYSTFEVEKNLITATYRMAGDKIIFEIISSDMKNPLVTGIEGGEVSVVSSFPVTVTQRAELIKNTE